MENRIDWNEDILSRNIPGFHRYSLTGTIRLDYVSENLCGMLGCSAEELLASGDGYARRIHPNDQIEYQAFLASAAQSEAQLSIEYRLIHQSGREIVVRDTIVSRLGSNGMQGFSTLADITDAVCMQNRANAFGYAAVPCGIIKFTCDETPHITYVNEQMLHMLRMPPGNSLQLRQSRQNIYLMIPPEKRTPFRAFLDKVYASERPLSGEIPVMRYDGSIIRLYGWICRNINPRGEEEFLSVCIDMTEHHERSQQLEDQRYLRALSQVYDEICEIDPSKRSIRFLQGRYFSKLGSMAHVPLLLDDTVRYWLENVVIEEDRMHVRKAFAAVAQAKVPDDIPLQIEFRVRYSNGSIGAYIGIFLEKSGNLLFCARNVTRQTELDTLKQENALLRTMSDQMSRLVMHFTDGMIAFEVCGGNVRPMYISDNVRSFFGYDEEQWLKIMHTYTPIQEFVSHSHISYDDFLDLLENREGEFNYSDFASGTTRRMRALCTSQDAEGRFYVVLHDVSDAKDSVVNIPEVSIRTFGYFDVFINGVPIAFRHEKAKELLAILTDRRGGFVTSAEAISLLWEDEEANAVTLARYRKVALRLKNTLEEHGIASIIETVDGKRRIVPQRIHCDLFEYFDGNQQLFKGIYLQNYSWGETTLAELMS